jgi:hypothetical protein
MLRPLSNSHQNEWKNRIATNGQTHVTINLKPSIEELMAQVAAFFAAIHYLVLELLAKAPRGRANPMFLAQFTAELLDLVRDGLARCGPKPKGHAAGQRRSRVRITDEGRRSNALGRIRMRIACRRLAHVTNQLDLRGASHKKARIRSSDSQM